MDLCYTRNGYKYAFQFTNTHNLSLVIGVLQMWRHLAKVSSHVVSRFHNYTKLYKNCNKMTVQYALIDPLGWNRTDTRDKFGAY